MNTDKPEGARTLPVLPPGAVMITTFGDEPADDLARQIGDALRRVMNGDGSEKDVHTLIENKLVVLHGLGYSPNGDEMFLTAQEMGA